MTFSNPRRSPQIENWRSLDERIHFVNSFAEAQREVNRQNSMHPDQLLVVLDLGTVALEKDLSRSAEALIAARPWMTTILISPMLNPLAEMEAVQELRVIQHCWLVRPDQITDVNKWKHFLRETFVEHTAADIHADLVTSEGALRKERDMLGVPVLTFDEPCLRELLRLTPGTPNTGALALRKGLTRSTLCTKYKRLGHTPSDFIILFRALWTKRLMADFPRPIPPPTSTGLEVLGRVSPEFGGLKRHSRAFLQAAEGTR